MIHQPVYVANEDTASLQQHYRSSNSSDFGNSNDFGVNSIWDDGRGIVALRKYYALRESRRMWLDTPPFLLFAIQCGCLFTSVSFFLTVLLTMLLQCFLFKSEFHMSAHHSSHH